MNRLAVPLALASEDLEGAHLHQSPARPSLVGEGFPYPPWKQGRIVHGFGGSHRALHTEDARGGNGWTHGRMNRRTRGNSRDTPVFLPRQRALRSFSSKENLTSLSRIHCQGNERG